MADEQVLDRVGHWSKALGLFPVPLVNDITDNQPSVLLNGSAGNFVLDLTGYAHNDDPRNYAWSSNVGHYITVRNDVDQVDVQRWDWNRAHVEHYRLKGVLDNLEEFHRYLTKQKLRTGSSIVAHTVGIFRRLRTVLSLAEIEHESLQAFLYMLACSADHTDRESLDLNRWGLSPAARSAATQMSSDQWESLIFEFERGRPIEQLVPHLNLLLRHAAGQLFQEAHYQVLFLPQQLSLTGFPPPPVTVGKNSTGWGVHFTPSFLVRTLVEAALAVEPTKSTKPLTIFDPACGSGEFLREVLRQLKLRRDTRLIKLIGWDISDAACAMAKFVLAIEQRDMPDVTIDIRQADALAEDQVWPDEVDMVLMNPPFVSLLDMPLEQRHRIREILGKYAGPRLDVSHAFILKAVTCLRDGGILGSILPASFLISDSAEQLRNHIGSEMAPRLIARLGSQLLFPGALVDAACYVAIKTSALRTPTIAFWADARRSSTTDGLRMLRKLRYWEKPDQYPISDHGFSIYMHPDLGKEVATWSPPPYRSWKLYENMGRLPQVQHLFDVYLGIRTGHNKAFLIPRVEWEALPTSEQGYFRPAVVNDAIEDGQLNITRYVFYPYGDYAIRTEAELTQVIPTYFEKYLLPHRTELLTRYGIASTSWWTLSRARNWREINNVKLVSKYFGGGGSFAFDSRGEFVVVQGLSWELKKAPSASMQRKIYLAYLAILNSSFFSELLAATSHQISGGQWNLSKRYVENIPLPDFLTTGFSLELIDQLASLGEQVSEQQQHKDEQIQELLAPLYRLDN